MSNEPSISDQLPVRNWKPYCAVCDNLVMLGSPVCQFNMRDKNWKTACATASRVYNKIQKEARFNE